MAAIAEALSTLESLLKNLAPTEIEQVVKSLKKIEQFQVEESSKVQEQLVSKLVKRAYTKSEKLELEIKSLFRYFEHRQQLLFGSLTAGQVAELLGTSRQTPHDRLKSKTLLGVLDRGVYRFPAWQFDPNGPDGVIKGLAEVLQALKVSDFAKISWLTRPNPFFEGLTPVEVLKKGEIDRVVREAAAIGVN